MTKGSLVITRILQHAKHNAVAYVALFVALGGTSYAAVNLPAGSVGNRQLKNHSVTPIKLDRASIAGYVRDWVKIDADGSIIGSRPSAHLVTWNDQAGAAAPGGLVSWGHAIPASCFALATTATFSPGPSYASAAIASAGDKNGPYVGAYVHLSATQQAVDVAVICPQP